MLSSKCRAQFGRCLTWMGAELREQDDCTTFQVWNIAKWLLGNVSETPTPTTCLKSTAIHLQFVRQYASHLYGSMPPICTAALLEKYWGVAEKKKAYTNTTERKSLSGHKENLVYHRNLSSVAPIFFGRERF